MPRAGGGPAASRAGCGRVSGGQAPARERCAGARSLPCPARGWTQSVDEHRDAERIGPARRPAIVGVINLSPESNVPGAHATSLPAVRERAAALCAEGADYVELGARSISHHRAPIDDAEEWRRLAPALHALVAAGYRVAVDTWSERCATAALAGGACLVNFTGAWPSAQLCGAVAASDATLCVLYLPYADPYRMRTSAPASYRTADILDRLRTLMARAGAAGLDRLLLDPNLGIFHPSLDDAAKIAYQVQAMRALPAVARLGCPTLAYLARKSALTSRQLIAAHLVALAVDYIRAHEPAIAVRAWELHAALPQPPGRPDAPRPLELARPPEAAAADAAPGHG